VYPRGATEDRTYVDSGGATTLAELKPQAVAACRSPCVKEGQVCVECEVGHVQVKAFLPEGLFSLLSH
jgi:hypothetical protein